MRKLLLVLVVLLAAVPVNAQCVGTTCGSSLTTYLLMCRVNGSCNKQDLLDNLNNNWIKLDKKFAPSLVLEGHGHRGTNGDGPLLSAKESLDCSNNPTNGQVISWNTSTSQCQWISPSGGGGGSGDVVGPGVSIDGDIATFNGTTGKLIRDNGVWKIGAFGVLTSVAGAIGIGDVTPDAKLDIEETLTDPAATIACSGVRGGSSTCQSLTNTITGGAGDIKVGLDVSATGVYDSDVYGIKTTATGGTATNTALEATAGNIIAVSGRIGVRDFSPDALIEGEADASIAVSAMQATCTGARTAGHSCDTISDTSTSSTGAIFKNALIVSSGGTWNGAAARNHAIYADASGGTTNYALYANAGDVVVNTGRLGIGDDTPDYLLEVEQAADSTIPAGITVTGARATSAPAMVIANSATGGDGSSFKTALQVTNGGVYNGFNVGILANVSGGTGANIAFLAFTGGISVLDGNVDVTGTLNLTNNVPTQTAFNVSCNYSGGTDPHCGVIAAVGDGTSAGTIRGLGMDVRAGGGTGSVMGFSADIDGESTSGTATGLKLSAHDAGTNIALIAERGTVLLQGSGSATPATTASLEAHSMLNGTATAELCDATGGASTCHTIDVTGDGTGSYTGQLISVAGGPGSPFATALQLSVSGGTPRPYALLAVSGDVVFGVATFSEYFHANDPDRQLILNKADGVADNVGGNALEVHNDTGQIGIESIAAGSGSTAIAASLSGATTSASTGTVVVTNSQTSSTAAINKVGLQVASTGTWNGAGAVNTGVQASASGGTLNYAFDALQGGVRGPYFLAVPSASDPVACATGTAGAVGYDSTLKLLCVCSNSDGSSFEWEAVEDRTVDCF